jgi:hypothetical protein
MDLFQITPSNAEGHMNLLTLYQALIEKKLMEQLELRHRKAMGTRQFSGVTRVINNRTSQGRRLMLKLTGCNARSTWREVGLTRANQKKTSNFCRKPGVRVRGVSNPAGIVSGGP